MAHFAIVATGIVCGLIRCRCLMGFMAWHRGGGFDRNGGHTLLLRMPAQRHGHRRHGLHGQPERGEKQKETDETLVHDAKITLRRPAAQATPIIRAFHSSSSFSLKLAASFCCVWGGTCA
jgi:hypothetical protein